MNKKQELKNKAGASSVIGVIVMVAITCAIVYTTFIYISGFEYNEDIIKSKIDIDENYTFIDMTFDYSVNDFYFVEIKLLDENNISTITVTGFLYNKSTEELLYNDSSDIIKLKEI